MKKAFVYLLVLGLMVIFPLSANATTSANISNTPDSETENSDGTVTKNYSIYVNTTANEELSTVDFGFQYGTAITNFVCSGAGDFEIANQESTSSNAKSCKFVVPNEGTSSGAKVLVGKVSITVNKNAKDEDCTIEYIYEGATGKINPKTGVSVPYAIIAGSAVLAVGVYFITKKRTKLYKI